MERLIERIRRLIEENPKISSFLQDNRIQLKRIAMVAVLVVAGMAAFAFTAISDGTEVVEDEAKAGETEVAESTIYVDIGGAVKTPMLAELPQGSRVEDAIVAAGGITEDADLSSINRADFLEDGQKVYIPAFDSVGQSASLPSADSTAAAGNPSTGGKVNINTADSAALQTINGIGPATAQKIIDYRNANGRFSKPEDLMNVSGIGEKTFEKMKDYITI